MGNSMDEENDTDSEEDERGRRRMEK